MGTILGQCLPMEKLWNDALPGSCYPGRKMNQNYSFFQASFNVLSDAVLASYPVHLFWKLQMKLRIKIALSILMGLGWVSCDDVTYAQSSLLVWASTEAWIIIIVGRVPPIRLLMERILQHLGLTRKKTSTPYYDQNHQAYGTYGTNRSHVAAYSNHQSIAYKNRQIIGDTNIMITTEFGTQFEEHNAHYTGSSATSQISGEGGIGGSHTDIQKVV
ncbi:hypothetical protein N7481_009818 [Penicillium waksmanii]|uniref:uncharacterized protein n=1 Tax=Penicillium waksmanii TaxID=69791 RepID=UPI0025495264|nr:uncharacterized protein N7481_009818 [Penicillium waksmanii]KAJ5976111.1 hypothetical protein N7481_009818 [Penicillium waksmanii]